MEALPHLGRINRGGPKAWAKRKERGHFPINSRGVPDIVAAALRASADVQCRYQPSSGQPVRVAIELAREGVADRSLPCSILAAGYVSQSVLASLSESISVSRGRS
jgi:hypothetical protein